MPRELCKYEKLVAGVEGYLLDTEASPFRAGSVLGVGWSLPMDEVATEIERMSAAGPAAIVFFGQGDTNGGKGGQLEHDPGLCLALATRGRTPRATSLGDEASPGLGDLVEFCRGLHGRADLEGVPNPLQWLATGPLILPWRPTTIAIVIMRFATCLIWTEGT